MPTGTMKTCIEEKGFGFIKPDAGGEDVFVHITEFKKAEIPEMREGMRLRYDLHQGGKGPQAVLLEDITTT